MKKGKYQQKTEFTLGLDKVAEKVSNGIAGDNPRASYFVTIPAYAGAAMARLFPDSLIDIVMEKSIRFNYTSN